MWLGFDCGTLMNEISALTKEIPDSSFIPSAMWGHSKKTAIYELECRLSPHTKYVGIFILDFPVSKTVRKKPSLFRSHLIYGILL